MLMLFLACGAVALFSFLAVASWSDSRRRERESYYKHETMSKIAEQQGGEVAIAYMREEKKQARRRELEGIRLGGMITAGVGIGLMFILYQEDRGDPVFWVGLIPLLVGVALLAHYFLAIDKE